MKFKIGQTVQVTPLDNKIGYLNGVSFIGEIIDYLEFEQTYLVEDPEGDIVDCQGKELSLT